MAYFYFVILQHTWMISTFIFSENVNLYFKDLQQWKLTKWKCLEVKCVTFPYAHSVSFNTSMLSSKERQCQPIFSFYTMTVGLLCLKQKTFNWSRWKSPFCRSKEELLQLQLEVIACQLTVRWNQHRESMQCNFYKCLEIETGGEAVVLKEQHSSLIDNLENILTTSTSHITPNIPTTSTPHIIPNILTTSNPHITPNNLTTSTHYP